MIRFFFLFLLLALLISPNGAWAKDNPRLTSRDNFEDFDDKTLHFEALDIDVKITSGVAQVTLHGVIENEGNAEAEARIEIDLPDGAIINGYALDIQGELVDGVLAAKERAETVYTDRVTQAIDPGIAERTAGNIYRTRIYPVRENGGQRKFRLSYAVVLPATGQLQLPFKTARPIETTTIRITPQGALRKAPQGQWRDQSDRNAHVLTATKTRLGGTLALSVDTARPSLSRHPNGKAFLTLPLNPEQAAQFETGQTGTPDSVTVIWDTSLSRRSAALAEERRLLRRYLDGLPKAPALTLIHGADAAQRVDDLTKSVLLKRIEAFDYGSASNLGALLGAVPQSDLCLLFSDGRSTLGEADLIELPCSLMSVSSDPQSNSAWLSLLSQRNAGRHIRLGSDMDAALSRLRTGSDLRLDVEDFDFQRFDSAGRTLMIAPIRPRADLPSRLRLPLRGAGIRRTLRYDLSELVREESAAIGAVWGEREVAAIRAKGAEAYNETIEAARTWSLEGPETSFIVLEEPGDYLGADVAPPRSYPKALRRDYRRLRKESARDLADDRKDHLENLKDRWDALEDWWKTDWSIQSRKKDMAANAPEPVVVAPAPVADMQCWDGTQVINMSQCPVEPTARANEGISAGTDRFNSSAAEEPLVEEDQIIVTGTRRVSSPGGQQPEIKLELPDWSPDRPYLTAIRDASDKRTEYLRQRETEGTLPAFYLEAADLFFAEGNAAFATRVALSALDLDAAGAETRMNVALRLSHYGVHDPAITIFRSVLPFAEDRPQGRYNLALALLARAQDAPNKEMAQADRIEAVTLLDDVALSVFDSDYEGIDLIALVEANAARERVSNPKQPETKLPRSMQTNLPMDLRILLDWSQDDADMDLWIEEPDGTRVGYSNRKSAQGGRYGDDMTDGYGPEDYLLRRAEPGRYAIEVKYYDSDAYSPDGAVNVRATIIRNFGTSRETRATKIIELTEDGEDEFIKVGWVDVER